MVSVAGDVAHDQVAEILEARFAGRASGPLPLRSAPAAPGPTVAVVRRPTEQAHLILGMRCVPLNDERRWAFAMLDHVLGGGLSSRLFQSIREERGLAYSVWS